jgi:acetyl-CoA carboxylase biotin carboxyl carrier protein
MSEKLTHTDIEEIMSLIEGSSFDQLSLEMGGLKLSLRRSPAQVADPFVSIGSKVAPDTVIGIIEVMKLMTSVQAGVSGTVAEIVAPDGELVEHGQVLIRVQLD